MRAVGFALLSALSLSGALFAAGELGTATGPLAIDGVENELDSARIFRLEDGRTIETLEAFAEYALDDERNALRLGPGVTLKTPQFGKKAIDLQITGGAAVVELRKKSKKQAITVDCAGATATLEKPGVYRFDCTDEPRLRVYKGKATTSAGQLASAQEVLLAGGTAAKFSTKDRDEFQQWHHDRSEKLEIERISSRKKTFGDVAPPGSGNW